MQNDTQDRRSYGLMTGLITGAVVGAGVGAVVALWLAPEAGAEVRQRAFAAGRALGRRTSDQCEALGEQVGSAVEELTRHAQDVRDSMADAVTRGAQAVERQAAAVKGGSRPHSL